MSLNAQRYTLTRPPIPWIVDPRVIYPDLEGDKELAREKAHHEEVEACLRMVDEYRAEVEAEQAQRRATQREGKGVAWVANLRREVRIPVPKTRETSLSERVVVVMRGHKLCLMHIV